MASPVQMFESGPLRYATLRTTGTEGFILNEDARFETTATDLIELSGDAQKELRFRHVAANGMQYVKSYQLLGDRYTIATSIELSNASAMPLRGSLGFALVQRWDESQDSDMYSFTGPATLVNEEIDEVDVDDLEEGSVSLRHGCLLDFISDQVFPLRSCSRSRGERAYRGTAQG